MKTFVALFLALSLSSCANKDGEPLKFKMSKAEALGAGVGAVIGGAVGYQFGSGLAQVLFSVGGAVAGGGAGYIVAQKLSPSDQTQYTISAKDALSNARDGQILNWTNPETGSRGIFRPTSTFLNAENNVCREYRAVVALEKQVLRSDGIACKISSGDWLAFSNVSG